MRFRLAKIISGGHIWPANRRTHCRSKKTTSAGMGKKKKSRKVKEEKEATRKKKNKSKGDEENATRDTTLWAIEEEELDEVWNLVKEQEMYRKAVELKHTADREVKEKIIDEEKLKEGEEGEEMEEEEMKKGQRIARWIKRELHMREWMSKLEGRKKPIEDEEKEEDSEEQTKHNNEDNIENKLRNEQGNICTGEKVEKEKSETQAVKTVKSGHKNNHSQANIIATQCENVSLESNSMYSLRKKACKCQACSIVSKAELGDQISCRAGVEATPRVCM